MKKPILIINYPDYHGDPQNGEHQRIEDTVKSMEMFNDFDVVIFWGCNAAIYYPPIEKPKDEPQPEQ